LERNPMTVNYTTNLALGQPVTGTESGTWGDDVNNSVTSYLDIAIAGGLTVAITTADVTLTITQGTSSATNISSTTAQYAILNVSGAMTAARNLILPSSSRQYVINNNTTGGFLLTVKGSATTGVTMVNGEKAHVFWNGSDYAKAANLYGTAVPTNGLYFPTTNAVGIATNTTNAVYIDASQNVGIGTSSPAGKLNVSRTDSTLIGLFSGTTKGARIGTNSTYSYIEGVDTTGSASYQPFMIGGSEVRFTTSDTERMRIDSAGVVTMSAYGAGAATFSAAGVISSVSDETWKIKDGVPVDPESMLKKLEPGYWYYNDEKKEIFGVDRQLGFYAQNVNAAIGPEAAPTPETVISKAEDGTDIVTTKPWGYYDRSVLAVTVMSLQKALATIESLTARIEALEAR